MNADTIRQSMRDSQLVAVKPGHAADPPEPVVLKGHTKAKVEFRWLDSAPVKGVTEDKGIRTSCGDELSYPHKKAVLNGADVARVRVSKTTFNALTNPQDMFMIHFELTADAGARLAATCGPDGTGLLAVFVDGTYRGAAYFQKSMTAATFEPFAGYFSSRDEVNRIVGSFK